MPKKRRGPSIRGRVMVDAVRGVLRVRKWPRKRGKPTSANQLWWIDWFKQANLLAKYADAASQIRAKQMTEGSGLYPRDVLLMAMRGKLYTWVDEDGWRWYPMAAIQDISESLDVLAQTVGSVLTRAADRWRAPAAGSIGDVLTYQGPAAGAAWLPAGGGGGFLGGCLLQLTANQNIPVGAWGMIAWDSEIYDTAGIHDNVVNPTRLTIPVGVTRIQIVSNIRWEGDSSGMRYFTIFKGGASFPAKPYIKVPPGGSDIAAQNMSSPVLVVAAGDYFEIAGLHSNSPNLDIVSDDMTWAFLQIIA